MTLVREIKPGVFSIGAIDWDRRLFDALIPLPFGTSYNSYLIRGSERTALVDAVDETKADLLMDNLRSLDVKDIDYIIVQHAEQDHSGALRRLTDKYPSARLVGSAKCLDLLASFGLAEKNRCIEAKDGEKIALGERSLEFISAPWVHWPDTIFTYLPEDQILFTCDFLGSHLAQSSLFASDEAAVYRAAKVYYAEIMMPFRSSVKKHLERIEGLAVEIIAPSHGPIYDRPGFIIDAYRDWSSDKVKNQVVLAYVSMHGSTRIMADHLGDALISRDVEVRRIDLTNYDLGEFAGSLVDAATVVIGTPTILAGAHPLAIYAATLARALRPKTRYASIIGSFGWGGKMLEQITEALFGLDIQFLDPVVARGRPKESDLLALDRLADEIAALHKNLI
ncbi:MAG: FprA family A-type flavoprotein [Methanothrix sp.]|jgi:flavorubredoxin|nr:FprA family A-type flavoprotein [Methanothrix sp.]